MHVSRVDTVSCRGGESPLWDVVTASLYFIDNFGGKVHRFTPVTGETRSWSVPGEYAYDWTVTARQ